MRRTEREGRRVRRRGVRTRWTWLSLPVLCVAGWGAPTATAQTVPLVERPVPGPVVPPAFFGAAVEAGTRTTTGAPGSAYWQQRANYRIEARLDPLEARVSGTGTIRYENRSPYTLQVLVLNLYQNLHAPGAVRNEPQEVTGGVEIRRVSVGGQPAPPVEQASAPPAHQVDGTILVVAPREPIAPGGSAEIEIEWAFQVPRSSAGRMGHSDHEVFFVAYWFPKMAVYDDLIRWDAEPYMGNAEFYDGFGDYEVSLTVPAGWTVMGTGELRNASEVFSQQTLQRLERAAASDTVVHVATAEDRAQGRVTASPSSGELTYRFRASNVRDFAWTASNIQSWDATSAVVPAGANGSRRVGIHTFWREARAPLWADQAGYAKHAVEHHSRYTGVAYPWPHMTSVEGDGIIGGGMEFPMLTVMGSYQGRAAEDLYSVTSHEIAHMWVPMIVGTNERRYAWMDEGSTTFLENVSREDRFPGSDPHGGDLATYLQGVGADLEQPLMRHGDYYEPGPGYGIASYPKPSALLYTLRELMGAQSFERAYRTFLSEWAYRHPTPWDFFNTFERFAGQDLDWFWQSFYYETWPLDHGIQGVEMRDGAPVITVVDHGFAVMPVRLTIETSASGTLEREVAVTEWLAGRTSVEISLPASVGDVLSVRIDPGIAYLDMDPSDNVWRPAPGGR
jgi:hypothetical protein